MKTDVLLRYEMKNTEFYVLILPGLMGQRFDFPRRYGHAQYEIIGDHSTWKTERDAQKLYFHFDENSHQLFIDTNGIFPNSICIAIKKIGGFSGPPHRTFESLFA